MKIKLYPKELLEAAWKQDKSFMLMAMQRPSQMPAVWRSSGSPPDGQRPQSIRGCADL